ncbi:hypothetical protein IEQ34_022636 [Dendrobium chrysotoxum]|uniref:Uncharacterized protein n=1 Tax=Dendrobium chrysotoxum TaxID=161865 RepID=A0AAV7FYE6_DENCH|nr:hypothetical protein IEQ34_022636 [Dendrobium chrysotoxum]
MNPHEPHVNAFNSLWRLLVDISLILSDCIETFLGDVNACIPIEEHVANIRHYYSPTRNL